MRPHRLLLVDDHPGVLRVMERLLARHPEFHVWATVTSAEGALAVVQFGGLDGVVTDHTLPGATGLELVAALRAQGATLPIVVMAAGWGRHGAAAMPDAGAQAVIGKAEAGSALVPALRGVLGTAGAGLHAGQSARRWRGTTSFMPDQTALRLQTLQSTRPAARPAAWTV